MKRFLIIVAILVGVALALQAIYYAIYPCSLTWSCPDYMSEGSLAAETETVQVAMNAMLADQNITTVTPNNDTTGSLGVNTWTALPTGPDAASLDGYLKKATTKFYFCWDNKGKVYAQNKEDGVKANPKDAKKQRLCKKALQP